MSRRRLKLVSWIACLAMLLSALVPALSHAFVSADAGWMEICSASGAKFVRIDGSGEKQSGSPKSPLLHATDHCPSCGLHVADMDLPPAPPAELAAPLLPAHDVPALFLHAPRTLHAWATAQPRAPPLKS